MDITTLRRPVDELLGEYNGKHVVYLPNPGNAGDSLIAVGTQQAFSRHNISFHLLEENTPIFGSHVILGGGGNFVPLYNDTRRAIENLLGRAERIIILPQTVRGNEDLLQLLDATCILFCRDRVSFDHVRRINQAIDVRLAHDMAFHVDVEEFMQSADFREHGAAIVEERLLSVGLSQNTISELPSVDFLRLGIESRFDAPETDADISVLFRLGVAPGRAELAAWCFLHTISLAKHINTDRLHVAIGAALLGIPCTLRDNSYGKNSSVYRLSLASFPNVRMVARVRLGSTTSQRVQRELPFTLQIPIYNETDLLEFSFYYHNILGLKPRYILDNKRTPEAEATLQRLNQEVAYFVNEKPYIEAGYESFAMASPTDWILRLDCDEVPSRELIDWCTNFIECGGNGVAGFERHQVVWQNGRLYSARTERFLPKVQMQWRLFNRTSVSFDTRIHTPGIKLENITPMPSEACVYHLSWQFLSFGDRLRKSDRYDRYGQPAANRANQLLPIEDADLAFLHAPLLQDAYLDWQSSRPAVVPENRAGV